MEELTREELLQQLQAKETAEITQLIQTIQTIVDEQGYVIIAIPQITNDGKLTAQWGLRRKS